MSKINHSSSVARRRQLRVRAKLFGTTERPRVTVKRSNHYMYVQVVNDETGTTIASANDLMLTKAKVKLAGTKTDRARQVAEAVAEQLKKQNIRKLCFDRGSYRYHGRVKAVAEAIRQAGLEM